MRKKLLRVAAAICAVCTVALFAGAVEINSYSEDLTVYYNGENVYANSENKPCIINDRTMVPLRPIFEAMGWSSDSISYDDATKSALFEGGDTSCEFVSESSAAVVYYAGGTQNEHFLDVPATIYNGNFYIPIRAFCEIWGADIEWDNATRSVLITEVTDVKIPKDDETAEEEVIKDEIPEDVFTVEDEFIEGEESMDDGYYEDGDEAMDLTEDEAVVLVAELFDDDMVISLDYSFEYEGVSYYQIEVSSKIIDDEETGEYHTSRATSYIVSLDGTKVFEGYYNQDTETLTNYEEESDEAMSQE